MSLTEVLARKNIDKGLDDIFKSSAGLSITLQNGTSQKRKSDIIRVGEGVKRPRTSLDIASKSNSTDRANKRLKKRKERQPSTEDDGDKDEDAKESRKSDDDDDDDASEGGSADEASDGVPEHESIRKAGKQKKRPKKTKYAPEGETREQRDARTIFIGNLPVAVVKNKPLKKQLRRHILSFVPSAKIESIRFRSIAFRNPTSTLPDDDGKSSKQKRSQQRAAEWRAEHVQTDGRLPKQEKEELEEDKKGEKKYMIPAEKRRLAAIKGELHEHGAATTNAYVVFAYPVASGGQGEAHVPRPEVMDPMEAALEAVRKAHGTIFADHILRVDLTGKPTTGGSELGATTTDPRLSIFVGNLDFASSEDDVRAFFETIMRDERGKPNPNGDATDGESGEAQPSSSRRNSTWITSVRIVRDKETQLGKGFAYVQFLDRDCVDEILTLEAEKLKFAKRTLRVQRCKTLPSLAAAKSKQAHSSAQTVISNATSKTRRDSGSATPLKGDPSLGTRLAGLPKEERKKAKASDAARVARRLAKKKARTGVDNNKEKTKKHARERKKGPANTSGKEKKKRVRNERNYQRKNVKK